MLTPIFLVIDSAGERLITVPGAVDVASAVLGRARQALDRVLPRRAEGEQAAADDEPDEGC